MDNLVSFIRNGLACEHIFNNMFNKTPTFVIKIIFILKIILNQTFPTLTMKYTSRIL